MKKNLFTLLAFAGLLSTACVKPIEPEVPESKEPVFSLFVNGLETKAETKAAYRDGDGVIWSKYSAGDWKEFESTIGIISATSSLHYQSSSYKIFDTNGEVDNGHGQQVSFGFDETPTADEYYAYQPYNAETTSDNIKYIVSGEQSQVNAGLMDVHDGSRLPCISTEKISIEGSTTSKETSFKSTAAILRFFVYDTKAAEKQIETIYRVSVIGPDGSKLSGSYLCNNSGVIKEESVSGTSRVDVDCTYTQESGSLLTSLKDDQDNVQVRGIYAVIIPASVNGCTYQVETNRGTYSFTSTTPKVWNANTIYDVTLNLSHNKAVFSPAPVPENLYLVGLKGNWKTNEAIKMDKTTDGDNTIFTSSESYYAGSLSDFRFITTNTKFENGYFLNLKEDNSAIFTPAGTLQGCGNFVKGNDNKFYRVKITFADGNGVTANVSYEEDNTKEQLPEHLYIIGGATTKGWANAGWLIEMDKHKTEPIYDRYVYLYANDSDNSGNNTFKFIKDKDTWGYLFRDQDNNNKLSKDGTGDRKFWVAQDGWYKIVLNLETMGISYDRVTEDIPYYLVGGYWNHTWDEALDNGKAAPLIKTGDHTFTWEGIIREAQDNTVEKSFKIRHFQANDWNSGKWYVSDTWTEDLKNPFPANIDYGIELKSQNDYKLKFVKSYEENYDWNNPPRIRITLTENDEGVPYRLRYEVLND